MGTGPGLPNVAQGEVFGSSTTTILVSNLPAHAHGLQSSPGSGAPCFNGPATTNNPAGAYPASVEIAVNDGGNGATATALAYATSANANMAGGGSGPGSSTGITGGSQPIDNQPPSLGMNCIIALQGIYPTRQ
jgi:microcystin-dependent protein